MQCFARWNECKNTGLQFRDQTILQFGDNWDLLANIVLLNPGSAVPLDDEPCDAFLEGKKLPFFIHDASRHYYRFTVDPLMRSLIAVYSEIYSGGVLKLYNLFNLRNQNSGSAIQTLKSNISRPEMFTLDEEIKYADAPVIIATGENSYSDEALTQELKKYVALADAEKLFSLSRIGDKFFSFQKTAPNENGLVDSYHPSYTCKYGNKTVLTISVN